MRKKQIRLIAALSYALFCFRPPCAIASDDVLEAEKFYKLGEYESASHYLYAALRANVKDGNAHYLLGNVLIKLNRRDEAIKEYRKATECDPRGVAGVYSKQALEALSTTSSSNIDSGKRESASGLNEAASLKRSVGAISSETSESQRNIDVEFHQKLAEINRTADEQINRLKAEMQQRIQENGQAIRVARLSRRGVYLGTVETYSPAGLNQAVKDEINPKIDALQKDRDRRVFECTQAHTAKALAIEDESVKLEQQYLDHNRSTGIKLTPAGTTRYTRSYETADEPSGAQVPVKAAPAKSLH